MTQHAFPRRHTAPDDLGFGYYVTQWVPGAAIQYFRQSHKDWVTDRARATFWAFKASALEQSRKLRYARLVPSDAIAVDYLSIPTQPREEH